jgi:hypothetical protein
MIMNLLESKNYQNKFKETVSNFIENKEEFLKKKQYVLFYPQIGKEYHKQELKLMFVGRCLNGWDFDGGKRNLTDDFDSSIKSTIEESIKNCNRFPVENGYDWKKHTAFWRVISEITKNKCQANKDNWIDKIAWSNMYKISPAKNGSKGTHNPNKAETLVLYESMFKLLKEEIDILNPDYVIMIVQRGKGLNDDWAGDFCEKTLKNVEKIKFDNSDSIDKIFQYKETQVIVTVRPERKKGLTNKKFVEDIVKVIKSNN